MSGECLAQACEIIWFGPTTTLGMSSLMCVSTQSRLVLKWIIPVAHEGCAKYPDPLAERRLPTLMIRKAEGGLGCVAICFIFILKLMALFKFVYHLVIRNNKQAEHK